MYKNTQNW